MRYIKSIAASLAISDSVSKNDSPLPKAVNSNQSQPIFCFTGFISDINVSNSLLDHFKANSKKLPSELS